jgi:hypothetical protein
MKHTTLLLLVILVSAAAASHCSQPLNCTGIYECPELAGGPGVEIVSGEKYCSCCPVSITYLGRDKLERAVCRSMALFSKILASRSAQYPMISPSSPYIFHYLNASFLRELLIK